jgi:hypothetical protein
MPDHEATPSGRSLGVFAAYGIAAALLLYFGFFVVVFFDEIVFGTHWIDATLRRVSPEFNMTVSATFRLIYAPLIWIVNHFVGIRR